MRHEYVNCQNCRVQYAYQSSGYGSFDEANNQHYCPRCQINILEALSHIPKTAEWTMVVIEGRDRELVLDEQKRKHEKPDTFMGLAVRRISGGLVRFEGNKVVASSDVETITWNGADYNIETWSDNSKPVEVRRRALRDIETGKVRLA